MPLPSYISPRFCVDSPPFLASTRSRARRTFPIARYNHSVTPGTSATEGANKRWTLHSQVSTAHAPATRGFTVHFYGQRSHTLHSRTVLQRVHLCALEPPISSSYSARDSHVSKAVLIAAELLFGQNTSPLTNRITSRPFRCGLPPDYLERQGRKTHLDTGAKVTALSSTDATGLVSFRIKPKEFCWVQPRSEPGHSDQWLGEPSLISATPTANIRPSHGRLNGYRRSSVSGCPQLRRLGTISVFLGMETAQFVAQGLRPSTVFPWNSHG